MISSAVFVASIALYTDQISTLQQIFQKSWEHAKDVYTCFIDLGKVQGDTKKNGHHLNFNNFWNN